MGALCPGQNHRTLHAEGWILRMLRGITDFCRLIRHFCRFVHRFSTNLSRTVPRFFADFPETFHRFITDFLSFKCSDSQENTFWTLFCHSFFQTCWITVFSFHRLTISSPFQTIPHSLSHSLWTSFKEAHVVCKLDLCGWPTSSQYPKKYHS